MPRPLTPDDSALMWQAAGEYHRAEMILDAAYDCQDPFCSHEGSACLWWFRWRQRRAQERREGHPELARHWEQRAANVRARR